MVRAWIDARTDTGHGADEAELTDALLADALLDLGGRAVQVADGAGTTYLSETVEVPDDPRDLARLLEEQSGLDSVRVEYDWQEQADWAELWKVGLDARRITERLVVTPSWIEPDAGPDDMVLVLDPGMAFGNAEHGTTRGCLRLLDGTVRDGDELLDVGAGSAVLSIAAAMLGAHRCLAVEGDELAIETARENAARNSVAERVDVRHAHVDAGAIVHLGRFDGVMCNIEGHLLAPLLPGLTAAVRPGGWLLLSGILAEQWSWFEKKVSSDEFARAEVDADGEWRSGLFRRHGGGGVNGPDGLPGEESAPRSGPAAPATDASSGSQPVEQAHPPRSIRALSRLEPSRQDAYGVRGSRS